MIKLKQILSEMTDAEIRRISKKIEAQDFRYVGAGDNARVYKFNNEDLIFKLTTSTDEIEVARQIQNKISDYSTFIPVYYVGDLYGGQEKYTDVIVMANAEKLSANLKRSIDRMVAQYKTYAYEQGGEVSIFDFVDQSVLKQIDPMIINFIEALRSDIEKLNITDLDLDLDFKSDNIMIWNGNMVMVDW